MLMYQYALHMLVLHGYMTNACLNTCTRTCMHTHTHTNIMFTDRSVFSSVPTCACCVVSRFSFVMGSRPFRVDAFPPFENGIVHQYLFAADTPFLPSRRASKLTFFIGLQTHSFFLGQLSKRAYDQHFSHFCMSLHDKKFFNTNFSCVVSVI